MMVYSELHFMQILRVLFTLSFMWVAHRIPLIQNNGRAAELTEGPERIIE